MTSGRLRLFEPDEDLGWQDRAACVGLDPELFFPDKGHQTHEAQNVCCQCPVRSECLRGAFRHNEQFGIFGGFTVKERRKILRRRQLIRRTAA